MDLSFPILRDTASMSTITGSVSPKSVTYDYEYSDDEDSQLGPLQQEWPFGGKGRSKDVPVPEGEKCQAISKLLANADRQAGEYSFGGRADTLPNVLGLVVKDVGPVSVPLTEEEATNLITKSKKSPFGHKFETKMDENVRNSWQLEPDQVEITNPQWSIGIKELTATIAARLGYEGVPLSCQLYKMLIYGQGGHFVKHQDTEKEDGMIATLVVQLPSLHEGGDLVIYRGGKPLYRHDFGKADGSAGYFPHYAVHYTDAEHSLETVTKGYRLVLVYSLCLPAKMVYLKKSHDKLLSDELAEAVGGMGADNESFALLLEHEYTEKSIGDLGVGALKGIDRARFSALKGANDVVPAYKQDGGREHDVRWFSTTGESFGSCSTSSGMNFLNPGHEAYAVLWRPHGSSTVVGYLGNEGGSMDTKYSRYAIKAWPAAQGVKTALRLSNVTVAAKCLQSQKPVGAVKLREFMELAKVELDKEQEVSTTFFQTLSELLVDTGDISLVDFFFTNIYKDRLDLAAPLIPIVRKFAWDDIGPILSRWLDGADDGKAMVVLLNIADGLGLDKGAAPTALVKLASERALELSCDELVKSDLLSLLWKWLIRCGDKQMIEKIATKFKGIEASQLGPVMEAFVENTGYIERGDDKCAVVASVMSVRAEWLKNQIEELKRPFSWAMPNAKFPHRFQIEAFLQGTDESMTTKGIEIFETPQDARNYAAQWMREDQGEASFEMEAAEEDGTGFVRITKTRDWFMGSEARLSMYNTELKLLEDCCDEINQGGPKKHART